MKAAIILLILRIRRRRCEEAARDFLLSEQASQLNAMADRKPKRQRLSLGGPAVDTSFEDFLTGTTKRISSSDEEEEIDQGNLAPGEQSEEEYDEEDESYKNQPQPEPESIKSALAVLKDSDHLVNSIIRHQSNTKTSTAKGVYYLLQARLILPEAPVAVTRLLRVPAILLFEQFSEAISAAFDLTDGNWQFTLELRPTTGTVAATSSKYPDNLREIADITSMDFRCPDENGAWRPSCLHPQEMRLMDIWGHTQIPKVRDLEVSYSYEARSRFNYAYITFMGVADRGLKAADLGVHVGKEQQIWCIGGSGACVPLDLDEEEFTAWKRKTNRHAWDIVFHNVELSTIQVREV